jgi:hypothetical protein
MKFQLNPPLKEFPVNKVLLVPALMPRWKPWAYDADWINEKMIIEEKNTFFIVTL